MLGRVGGVLDPDWLALPSEADARMNAQGRARWASCLCEIPFDAGRSQQENQTERFLM